MPDKPKHFTPDEIDDLAVYLSIQNSFARSVGSDTTPVPIETCDKIIDALTTLILYERALKPQSSNDPVSDRLPDRHFMMDGKPPPTESPQP